MALLGYQQITVLGTTPNYVAASAGGDSIYPDDRGFLDFKNGSASAISVTLVVPGVAYGVARPDVVVSIPAGGERCFGPLIPDLADPSDGQVDVTYSSATSLTVAALRG